MSNSSAIPDATSDRFLYVGISFGLVIVLLIFSADDLFGAVGLRAWYNPIGVVAATASLLLLPFVMFYQQFPQQGRHAYLMLAAFLILVAFQLRVYLTIVGWFTSLATGALWIPASTIAIIFSVFLVIQLILSYLDTKVTTPLARLLIISALLYSSGYFFGVAASPRYAEAEISDRRTYGDHQYFLYLWFGWLGDPDYLALYECNQFGLFCKITYQAPTGYYRDSQLSIEPDPQTQLVGVKIDDLFSPYELTEADVAYLCEFFDIPEEDSFCSNPAFQDYNLFWRVLTRKLDYDLSYASIVPYFEQTESFTEATCPPPNKVLSNEQMSFTCQLHFPGSELVLELSMHKSSYRDEVWHNVNLVNPNCNCNNN